MTTHIIHHEVKPGTMCPDGIAAAAIAYKALTEKGETDIQIHGDTYRNEADYHELELPFQPQSGDRVFIVDFSYPKHWLEELASIVDEVIVLDHHISRLPMLQGLADTILLRFDTAQCGTTLTWKYFYPDQPIPELLIHVRHRDINSDYWDGKLPRSEAINTALGTLRHERRKQGLLSVIALFAELLSEGEAALERLQAEGEREIGPRDEIVRAAADRWEWTEFEGYRVPIVYLQNDEENRHYSWVGHELCERCPEAEFAIIICHESPNTYHLRSSKKGKNFNVAELCEKLGGGGQHNAAGVTLKRSEH